MSLCRGSNGTVMRKQDSLCLLASPVQAYLPYPLVNPVLPSNPAKGWVKTPADGWMGQQTRLRRNPHSLPGGSSSQRSRSYVDCSNCGTVWEHQQTDIHATINFPNEIKTDCDHDMVSPLWTKARWGPQPRRGPPKRLAALQIWVPGINRV